MDLRPAIKEYGGAEAFNQPYLTVLQLIGGCRRCCWTPRLIAFKPRIT